MEGTTVATIVVGVDGSPESKKALRWALDEARLRGAGIEVVHIHQSASVWFPYGDTLAVSMTEAIAAEYEEAQRAAGEQAKELVDTMIDELGDTGGVRVEPVLVADANPASTLVERSREADLLVVGSRGRGGFAGLLLGSVSQQVASHAHCPVVIVSDRTAG